MSLPELPGLGPQLQKRILQNDRSGAKFLHALERGAVEELVRIQGISRQRAVSWIQLLRGEGHDTEFLATPKAKKMHEEILQRIKRYTKRQEIADRISLLSPLATPEEAQERLADIERHMQATPTTAYEQLQGIKEPKPQHLDRVLVAENDDVATKARALGLDQWCSIMLLEEVHPSQAGPFQLLYRHGEHTLDGAIESDIDGPLYDVVPELFLAWARTNHTTLQALATLDCKGASTALAALEAAPISTNNKELGRIVENLRLQAVEDWKQRLQGIHVTAHEYLEATQGQLPRAIQTALDEVYNDWDAKIYEETGHRGLLTHHSDLQVDEEELAQALRSQQEEALQTGHQARCKQARIIAQSQESILDAYEDQLEQAVLACIARFALDNHLQVPRVGGILAFHSGRHLDLGQEAQPIEYQLGQPERLALLTGANSGGKSTFLELLSQMTILCRMGLPVPAQDAVMPWFAKLHYVQHTKTLDAGAFESLLRSFQPLLDTPNALVLLDEVEAVTEPEAASRILAFFLERLERMDATAIVVTHMAPSVLSHARVPLRVDGIEATGLDDQHKLIVNRCPKQGYLARSTPELIVRRLSETTRGEEQILFQDLLQQLRSQEHPVSPQIQVQS